jgi:hypothetical protein
VGAGKAGEGNGIEPLAGEGAIPHAVQVGDGGAIEGHAQQAPGIPAGDRPIGAVAAAQKAAVGAGGAYLLQFNVGSQLGPKGLQAADEAVGGLLFLDLVLAWVQPLPGGYPTGGKGMNNVAARGSQVGIQQGGDGDKKGALLSLHLIPIFQENVVTIAFAGQGLGPHPQVQA